MECVLFISLEDLTKELQKGSLSLCKTRALSLLSLSLALPCSLSFLLSVCCWINNSSFPIFQNLEKKPISKNNILNYSFWICFIWNKRIKLYKQNWINLEKCYIFSEFVYYFQVIFLFPLNKHVIRLLQLNILLLRQSVLSIILTVEWFLPLKEILITNAVHVFLSVTVQMMNFVLLILQVIFFFFLIFFFLKEDFPDSFWNLCPI